MTQDRKEVNFTDVKKIKKIIKEALLEEFEIEHCMHALELLLYEKLPKSEEHDPFYHCEKLLYFKYGLSKDFDVIIVDDDHMVELVSTHD